MAASRMRSGGAFRPARPRSNTGSTQIQRRSAYRGISLSSQARWKNSRLLRARMFQRNCSRAQRPSRSEFTPQLRRFEPKFSSALRTTAALRGSTNIAPAPATSGRHDVFEVITGTPAAMACVYGKPSLHTKTDKRCASRLQSAPGSLTSGMSSEIAHALGVLAASRAIVLSPARPPGPAMTKSKSPRSPGLPRHRAMCPNVLTRLDCSQVQGIRPSAGAAPARQSRASGTPGSIKLDAFGIPGPAPAPRPAFDSPSTEIRPVRLAPAHSSQGSGRLECSPRCAARASDEQ